jgi:hypothetical protein
VHAERVYFEQLRRVVRLESVIARYGVLDQLKRSGQQLVGCCPIHRGRNRKQFVVDLAQQVWRCFSPECDAGGGMLEFVAAMERVEVRDAALRIADWFAVRPESYRQPKRRRVTVSSKPSHKAYVVEDRAEGEEGDAFWTRIGSAWPHKDGKGINIVLSALPANGRLVLREYTDEDAKEEEDKKKAPARKR